MLFLTKKSLLTLFKTLISLKLGYIELQNKFILIRNKLLKFIQFSLLRLLEYFLSFRFLKTNAPFFRVGVSTLERNNFRIQSNQNGYLLLWKALAKQEGATYGRHFGRHFGPRTKIVSHPCAKIFLKFFGKIFLNSSDLLGN